MSKTSAKETKSSRKDGKTLPTVRVRLPKMLTLNLIDVISTNFQVWGRVGDRRTNHAQGKPTCKSGRKWPTAGTELPWTARP